MIVTFRKFGDDQIIALFPEEVFNDDYIPSYMEIGQHSGASMDLITDLKGCNSIETLKGIKMLQNVGYKNLRVKR